MEKETETPVLDVAECHPGTNPKATIGEEPDYNRLKISLLTSGAYVSRSIL